MPFNSQYTAKLSCPLPKHLYFDYFYQYYSLLTHHNFVQFCGENCISKHKKRLRYESAIYFCFRLIQSNIVISVMQRQLQRNLQKDIKHIVNMQSLLEEYDRQNKYLNKQVLELINQNTRLRMDKVKANIINDMLHLDKKNNKNNKKNVIHQFQKQIDAKISTSGQVDQTKTLEESKKLERNSSKKLIQKFKVEREDEPINVNIIKKDEAIQTPILDKVAAQVQQQKQQHNIPIEKPKEDNAFSFRNTPCKLPFQSQSASSKEFISQIDVKFTESPHVVSKNQNIQSRTLFISRQISQPNLPQSLNNTLITQNQSTIKRESTLTEHLKRSHAIKPSPQVNTSLSKNRQFMTPSSSEKQLGERSDSKTRLRPFESMEKKKRFLQIVSISRTPVKLARKEGDDCC